MAAAAATATALAQSQADADAVAAGVDGTEIEAILVKRPTTRKKKWK